ncbi:prepilin-type N-terminal cleavage/methylation domain-containing protein [Vibrio cidicii]|uniref:pilin n=1 Tax=Vibrio cidicii TaxID=1763883 RepID=UPI0018C2CBEF|nr:pilin [Vibrio cidicii]MBG0757936.1 prepilin-type N-terminal cleavage/methylation domain-containing protein [Vibrio cidicii]
MKKHNRVTKQQGFTLIELMIVVAVIGVLAAIAVPQYQKYVAKSEAASALATLTGLKTNAEAYTVETGSFPTNAQNATLGTPTSIMGAITYANTSTSGAGGNITFTFSGTVSPDLKAKSIRLVRDTSGNWTCASASAVDAGIRPKGCSTTY